MRPIATGDQLTWWSVGVSVTRMRCLKTAKRIEVLFDWRPMVLDGVSVPRRRVGEDVGKFCSLYSM